MANHNQFKKVSAAPQANTIVYSDANGYISDWLEADPVIQALKQQTEFIGTIPTAPEPDTQSILTQFVVDTTGRQPRNGDEVAIEDVGELWLFNGSSWNFFTNTTLKDATTTSKGIVQIGTGLNVSSGIVSVDSTIYTAARISVTNTSTTPSLALQSNTDYVFSNALTSLTLMSVPDSPYYTTLTFTTGSTFTYTASTLTQYFYDTNPPTFLANTTYRLTIVDGKCYVDYIGARQYPINKITVSNGALTPTNNIVTWAITNTLGTRDVFIRVYETSTGETVEVESIVTNATITLKLYTENNSVNAGIYTAVILG